MDLDTIILFALYGLWLAYAALSVQAIVIMHQNPRPAGMPRRAHTRQIRSLPKYRRFLLALRLVSTIMSSMFIVYTIARPSPPGRDWIFIALCIAVIIASWTVDRHPPDENRSPRRDPSSNNS